jgi:hypothetical protein
MPVVRTSLLRQESKLFHPVGFLIAPDEIEVCTRPDGTEWLLVGIAAFMLCSMIVSRTGAICTHTHAR